MPDDLQRTLAILDCTESWKPLTENGAAPNPDSIRSAREWVTSVYTAVTGEGLSWRQPNISLDEEGDPCFEWWSGQKKVDVYIEPNGLWYLYIDWATQKISEAPEGDTLEGSIAALEWILSDVAVLG